MTFLYLGVGRTKGLGTHAALSGRTEVKVLEAGILEDAVDSRHYPQPVITHWGWIVSAGFVIAAGTIVIVVAWRRRRAAAADPVKAGQRALRQLTRESRVRGKGTMRGKGHGGDESIRNDAAMGGDSSLGG